MTQPASHDVPRVARPTASDAIDRMTQGILRVRSSAGGIATVPTTGPDLGRTLSGCGVIGRGRRIVATLGQRRVQD